LNFVQTLNGSEIATETVVEVMPTEARWLVKLRLHDGSIRFAITEKWERARTLASRKIVPSTVEVYLLTINDVEGKLVPRKQPIVAWALDDGDNVVPVTCTWVHTFGNDCALLYPDGSVVDGDERFDSLKQWLECEQWLRDN
jgi:hypothetical protein